MEFRILGALGASDERGEVDLGGRRHRLLLACMLADAGATVPAQRLVEALWGEHEPTTARQVLQVRMSELRKLLAVAGSAARIVTRPPGYRLELNGDGLDAARFEQLAAAGRAALADGDLDAAAARLRAALATWTGPALVDLADRAFAQAEITRWEDARMQVQEDLFGVELEAGRHAAVAVELHGLILDQPLRERLRAHLMLALYRSGRQGEALEVYRVGETRLREELGIDPAVQLQELRDAILRQDPELLPDPPRPALRHNLPVPLTSFVGRARDLADLDVLLASSRLVTLTGVGGAGKSRLAMEVAASQLPARPGGVWVVELASVREPDLVESTVAGVLRVPEHPQLSLRESIVERLRDAAALLVIDNCEHLVAAVAELVSALLQSCPVLVVLCASRERLAVAGEVVRVVTGLSVIPDADGREPEAVHLFRERATAATADHRPDVDGRRAVAEICRRLDGLPLAVELAAARTAVLAPSQIADRLTDRFRFLTGRSRDADPRHQTLRAVVDWSYDLLDADEQDFFDRLAVFVGGFTLEAAEHVCRDGDADAAADLLARLVDKSLVVVDAADLPEYRYLLLETLREYALERLTARVDAEAVQASHGAFYAGLARRAAVGLRTDEQPAWLARLRAEHGNLRAALDRAVATGDHLTNAVIAGSLYQFWDLHGHYTEGLRRLELARRAGGTVPAADRARVLIGIGTLATIQSDVERAVAACDEAVAVSRTAGDAAGEAHALQYLGLIAIYTADLTRARELLDTSLATARGAGAAWEHGWALLFLGMLALAEGEPAVATAHVSRSEQILAPIGDREAASWLLGIQGAAAWLAGDHRTAGAALAAGIRSFHELGAVWGTSVTLAIGALVIARDQRRAATAVYVLAAADAMGRATGAGSIWFSQIWVEECMTGLRALLGSDRFTAAWLAGAADSADAVVEAAVAALSLDR